MPRFECFPPVYGPAPCYPTIILPTALERRVNELEIKVAKLEALLASSDSQEDPPASSSHPG